MTEADEYDQGYTDYQLDRSAIRKAMRRPYLRAAARFVRGPAVDLGCGVGELLAHLPPGSMGLEINRATVEHCRGQGLDVAYYDGWDDDWHLAPVGDTGRQFDTLIMSHVLEHLNEPVDVLRRVFRGAGSLGIRRVLVQVPGRAGYRHDPTHRTFVDREMLSDAAATDGTGYAVTHTSYFPGNRRAIGDCFAYHELRVAYDRT